MIREYTGDDARATLALFRRAILVTARPFYTPDQLRAWAGTRTLDQWNAQRLAQHTLISDEDGRVLGFLGHDDTGLIDMLFVDPGSARRGIATSLLNAALTDMTARSIPEARTWASLVARPFFEQRGFAVARPHRAVVSGVVLDNVLMHRTLVDPAAARPHAVHEDRGESEEQHPRGQRHDVERHLSHPQ